MREFFDLVKHWTIILLLGAVTLILFMASMWCISQSFSVIYGSE